MTQLLFQTDSYLKEFEASVLEVDPDQNRVALDRTAFYPGGGGQPHDIGELVVGDDTLNVIRTKREGDLVWHWVEGTLPPASSTAAARIDWERRYRIMRTHTALHILCGVIWRGYRAQVTGGNMEPLEGRLDFEFETLQREMIDEIENKINVEVENAREVVVRILPREEANRIPDLIRTKVNLLPPALTEIRTIDIVGLDVQADGGTHVANTREVGRIRVVDYKSKGRINKRIRIALDP